MPDLYILLQKATEQMRSFFFDNSGVLYNIMVGIGLIFGVVSPIAKAIKKHVFKRGILPEECGKRRSWVYRLGTASRWILVVTILIFPFYRDSQGTITFLRDNILRLVSLSFLVISIYILLRISDKKFREWIEDNSYKGITTNKNYALVIECRIDRPSRCHKIYIKNNTNKKVSLANGKIEFYSNDTLVYSIPITENEIQGKKRIEIHSIKKADDGYYKTIHPDEIYLRASYKDTTGNILEIDSFVLKLLYSYSFLNYYNYWHIFNYRIPFEITWFKKICGQVLKGFFFDWPSRHFIKRITYRETCFKPLQIKYIANWYSIVRYCLKRAVTIIFVLVFAQMAVTAASCIMLILQFYIKLIKELF